MKDTSVFDVLVVYSEKIATSASKAKKQKKPFSVESKREEYNHTYAYFLETCQKNGLTAAFSTTADINGAGTCKSYWVFKNKTWEKIQAPCFSQHIFTKFSQTNKENVLKHRQLFSSDKIKPFNNPSLKLVFSDKYNTYQTLLEPSIPTVSIEKTSKRSVTDSVSKLKTLISQHPNPQDFDQHIIVKDRFGAGGNNIFLVTDNYTDQVYRIVNNHIECSFVIQPLVKFSKGFSYKNMNSATDIRLIYHNGEIIQTYLRIAKEGDFRCNTHQGGSVIYVNTQDIPSEVLAVSKKICHDIGKDNSLFALDFIVSNLGNVYLLEGNSGPGINWDETNQKDEEMAKELIHEIVNEFSSRINQDKNTSHQKIDEHTLPVYF